MASGSNQTIDGGFQIRGHRTQIGEFGIENPPPINESMEDEIMFDPSCIKDEVEKALLSAVQRARNDYDAATAEDRPIWRKAYADTLRAFNSHITASRGVYTVTLGRASFANKVMDREDIDLLWDVAAGDLPRSIAEYERLEELEALGYVIQVSFEPPRRGMLPWVSYRLTENGRILVGSRTGDNKSGYAESRLSDGKQKGGDVVRGCSVGAPAVSRTSRRWAAAVMNDTRRFWKLAGIALGGQLQAHAKVAGR